MTYTYTAVDQNGEQIQVEATAAQVLEMLRSDRYTPGQKRNLAKMLMKSDRNLSDLMRADRMQDSEYAVIPTPFPSLNDLLSGGLPVGQITVIASEEGRGKTSLQQMLTVSALENDQQRYIADKQLMATRKNCIFLLSAEATVEENKNLLAKKLAGSHHMQEIVKVAGSERHLIDDNAWEAIEKAYEGRVWNYKLEVGIDAWERFKTAMEMAIVGMDCNMLIIDNIMKIQLALMASGQNRNTDIFEIQQLVMNYMTELIQRYRIAIVVISHKAKTSGRTYRIDKVTGEYTYDLGALNREVYGTYAITGLAGLIVHLIRPDEMGDANQRHLVVSKARCPARTSVSPITITYDPISGRLAEEGDYGFENRPMSWDVECDGFEPLTEESLAAAQAPYGCKQLTLEDFED